MKGYWVLLVPSTRGYQVPPSIRYEGLPDTPSTRYEELPGPVPGKKSYRVPLVPGTRGYQVRPGTWWKVLLGMGEGATQVRVACFAK